MLNAFAVLQLPPRPWLPEAGVREAFHRLAAELHPDQAGGDHDRFSELTSAFEILRHPLSRIRHLMELEAIGAPQGAGGVPPELIDLFPKVAQARQELSRAVTKRQAATNSLARSLAAADVEKARRTAQSMVETIDSACQGALDEVQALDSSWPSPSAREGLPGLHARLAFLVKWRDQLRESLLQLQLS